MEIPKKGITGDARITPLDNIGSSSTMKIDLQYFASKEKQYGKKIGKHAQDFLGEWMPAKKLID